MLGRTPPRTAAERIGTAAERLTDGGSAMLGRTPPRTAAERIGTPAERLADGG